MVPGSPCCLSLWREERVGREALPVDHCLRGLLSTAPGADTKLLRDVAFLPQTWHRGVPSKNSRCFSTNRVVWRHLQMPPLHRKHTNTTSWIMKGDSAEGRFG